MKKLTIKDCQEFVSSIGGSVLSLKYINTKTKIEWQCKNKHIWSATFGSIKNGSWCPHCANKAKITIEKCQELAKYNNGKILFTNIKNSKEKVAWKCNLGHTWQTSFNSISKGSWCPYCAKKDKKTIKNCIDIAKENNGECISIEIKNIDQKLKWKCINGHIWKSSFHNIKNKNRWCPHCSNLISKPQKEIYDYLIDTFMHFNIILNDTQTIKPLDLDIYINELKLAIEYDGEYWHYSEWAIKEGSLDRMKRKDELCKERGIKLIRIREKDWKENKELELQKIINFINKERQLNV